MGTFSQLSGYAIIGTKRIFQRIYRAYKTHFDKHSVEEVRDALLAVDGDPSIYFLCFGNICRSPFAERSLRKYLDLTTIEIGSGGFYAEIGRASPKTAQVIAADLNVSLDDHRSQCVTRNDLERADIVFIMDYQNLLDLRWRFSDLDTPVLPLGVLDGSERVQIPDPYGGDEEKFRETYQRIMTATKQLARLIEMIHDTDKGK